MKSENLPRFITVEGPIGVGKTSLTKKLAESLNYDTFLETAESNPFLERFYQNRRQLLKPNYFSLSSRQIQELRQGE